MELRTRLECPEWAWPHFEAAFGDRVEPELRALLETPPLDLRVNTLKTTRDDALDAIRAAGFAAEPTPYSPVGIRLAERSIPLGTIPGLLEGEVDPQDEGSQLVALLVGARPGEVVADYCAGSGGKTLALAAEMENRGRLVAMDIDDARLGRSAPRHVKAGVDNVQRHTIVTDGKDAWLKRESAPSTVSLSTRRAAASARGGATPTRAAVPAARRGARRAAARAGGRAAARRVSAARAVRSCTRRARCSAPRTTTRSPPSSRRTTAPTLSRGRRRLPRAARRRRAAPHARAPRVRRLLRRGPPTEGGWVEQAF